MNEPEAAVAGGEAPPPVVSLSSSPLAPDRGCLPACRLGDSALLQQVGHRRAGGGKGWTARGRVPQPTPHIVVRWPPCLQLATAPSPHLMALPACRILAQLFSRCRAVVHRCRAVVQPLPRAAAARWRRLPERSVCARRGGSAPWMLQPDGPATALGGAPPARGPGRFGETRHPDPMARTARVRGTRGRLQKTQCPHGLTPQNAHKPCWAPTPPLIAPWGYFASHPQAQASLSPWNNWNVRLCPPPRPLWRCLCPRTPAAARRGLPEAHGSLRRCSRFVLASAPPSLPPAQPPTWPPGVTTHALQPGSLVHRRRGGLVRPGAGEAAAVKRTLPPRHSSSLFT